MSELEIFAATHPGLEKTLLSEVSEAGFNGAQTTPGGVSFSGSWSDAWRANLVLRGAARILVRIGGFPVFHLAQLDKRSRKFAFDQFLSTHVPLRVEVTCKASKIYHAGAAAQRIERALVESHGIDVSRDSLLRLLVRIENNFCQFSLDTSGDPLHRRGYKEAVGKAPMRETLASLFLREMGFDGTQTVVDPMCGSGTFAIEAASWSAGLHPGRNRKFTFEMLKTFDENAFLDLRGMAAVAPHRPMMFGFDRDQGAVHGAGQNASRAGVEEYSTFRCQSISDLRAPETAPGIVIINPPYGARIGNKKTLYGLYGSTGRVLKSEFSGWRVGIITSEGDLAKATGLPFLPPGPIVSFGGLKVRLWQTAPLP